MNDQKEPQKKADTNTTAKDDFVHRVVEALHKKSVQIACPRCGQKTWGAQQIAFLVTDPNTEGFLMPPPQLPVVILTCQNCGWVSMHDLKTLGVEP